MSDKDVWQTYTKGVKRIKSKPVKKAAVKLKSEIKKRTDSAPTLPDTLKTRRSPSPAVQVREVTLDRRVERNMRSGEIEIEAKLDLHGLRQQEAHEALQKFMLTQAGRGKRTLLVITGKGGVGGGVLRKNFPLWCAEPDIAALILALRPAAAKHGGDGAWYVMLRKNKK